MKSLRLPAGIFILATLAATGCSDATATDDHDEPDIAAIEIIQGTNVVRLSPGLAQSGTMTVEVGATNAVSIRVLDSEGQVDEAIAEHPDEFEIRITQQGTSRFTQTSTAHPYTGTITPGAATGQAVYQVVVFSTEHGHDEFGPLNLTLTVANADVQ